MNNLLKILALILEITEKKDVKKADTNKVYYCMFCGSLKINRPIFYNSYNGLPKENFSCLNPKCQMQGCSNTGGHIWKRGWFGIETDECKRCGYVVPDIMG